MPYAARPMIDDPNDPQKKQNGVNISGGGGADFSTGVPGQDGGAGKEKRSSGQYANIQSYLNVNGDQADQMGQKIATDVTTKADDATSKINTLSTKAPTVEAYDPNSAIGNATSLSDDDKAKYKNFKATGGYSGPATVDKFEGYEDAQKSASAASTAVKNAGTETGQQQLLKDTYKRPTYSAGQNRLDQVLLQNSSGSKSALEGVTKKYGALNSMFNDTLSNVGTSINNAVGQAASNRQNIVSAEQAAIDALVNPIQARASEGNKNNLALIDRAYKDAEDSTLSEESLKLLGLSEGQNLFDLNLQSYLTPDRTQGGLDNFASSDERSKYAALASLFENPTLNQITANGGAINPLKFDSEGFRKDLDTKKSEAEDIINNRLLAVNPRTGQLISGTSKGYTPQQMIDQLRGYLAQGGEGLDPAAVNRDIAAYQKQITDAREKYGFNRVVTKG